MNRETILITEVDGNQIEIKRAHHTEIIKKNFDEVQYCHDINTFFDRKQMKALTTEEQILARGYLAWSYFWPKTIYKELFSKYPLENFDYKCNQNTDLARFLLWSQDKQAWNILHWIIYFLGYLPFMRLRLSLFVRDVLVGFSIQDERWGNINSKSSFKIGGGKWPMNGWLNSMPLLHPRKYTLTGDIFQKVLAHVKNMTLSKKYLQLALPHFHGQMHFWDDFNYTYPLFLAAQTKSNKIIVHQHAPSFTRVHVTGQILSNYQELGQIEWSCWDKEWASLAHQMNQKIILSKTAKRLPFGAPIPFNSQGTVVFPWEAFCDNSLKKAAIVEAINIGLSVAIKLRPGYAKDLQLQSFGLLENAPIMKVTDWKELKSGVRVIVGGQTALLYQAYLQGIPVCVMAYASETYKDWVDKNLPSQKLINCHSEQQLFSALQALVGRDIVRE